MQPSNPAALTAEWVVDGETFSLVQFHFHQPSEHTLRGYSMAAEAHFVHRAPSGRIAVFGIMFDEDAVQDDYGGSGGGGSGNDNPLLSANGFWDTIYKPTPNVTVDVGSLVNDVQEVRAGGGGREATVAGARILRSCAAMGGAVCGT